MRWDLVSLPHCPSYKQDSGEGSRVVKLMQEGTGSQNKVSSFSSSSSDADTFKAPVSCNLQSIN
ncbi:hypothetical protein E2C01_089548 [Portunus trituberculatus]|uniref:Uncharacterized protein n=1 Tax=Portunus trituberculatus TaxID=210409 RepID=A0A5B7J933_PORTR|nr:hypothetical protein [Portunus trituberculatus]